MASDRENRDKSGDKIRRREIRESLGNILWSPQVPRKKRVGGRLYLIAMLFQRAITGWRSQAVFLMTFKSGNFIKSKGKVREWYNEILLATLAWRYRDEKLYNFWGFDEFGGDMTHLLWHWSARKCISRNISFLRSGILKSNCSNSRVILWYQAKLKEIYRFLPIWSYRCHWMISSHRYENRVISAIKWTFCRYFVISMTAEKCAFSPR